MRSFSILLLAVAVATAALVQPALSTIVITHPVAATKVNGGDRMHVTWNDDGKAPKLSSDWGRVNVWLAAGSQDVQFKLQLLAENMGNNAMDATWRVDPNIGPNGNFYFIRMEGTKAMSNGLPPMSFSARFTLNGMKGNFNSTVMAAAQGREGPSAPTGAAASGATSAAAAGAAAMSTAASSSMVTSVAPSTSLVSPLSTSSLANKTSGAAPRLTSAWSLTSLPVALLGVVAGAVAML